MLRICIENFELKTVLKMLKFYDGKCCNFKL
jgi:hypothetical protein